MTNYPTKEEIMATQYKIKYNDLVILSTWKELKYKEKWKDLNWIEKTAQLTEIIMRLNLVNEGVKEIKIGKRYCYNPKTKTITLDQNNPSIISTLHEYAHHILGPDELEACRWSIWLFKECFPKEFKTLEWKGHMLKKKICSKKSQQE